MCSPCLKAPNPHPAAHTSLPWASACCPLTRRGPCQVRPQEHLQVHHPQCTEATPSSPERLMPQPLSCSLPCLSRTHGSSPRSSWEITSGLDPGIPAHGEGSPFVYTISTSTLTSPHPRPAGGLTHGDHIPIGLHHHVSVEATLGGAQAVPLILGEEHGHILEGHLGLEQQGGLQVGLRVPVPDKEGASSVGCGDAPLDRGRQEGATVFKMQ